MAYLGAIDLVVNKTVSILTIKRLPTEQVNTPDIGITTTQVTTYSIGFNSNITAKFDITMGGLTSVRTIPNVQTYYNKTFNYISNTNTTVTGISQVTSLKYNPIVIGAPSVSWNTNPGSLGTFLTNSVVGLTVSASTNTGGTISYSVTSGSLPVNLSLNTSNGAITGVINNTITTNTTYTFTIRATESVSGAYTDNTFTITESARDAYFNYVTLLLNGESPSGNSKNTNTWIIDNSNSALALVPVNKGNVTQGSYGPFNTVNPNGWSTFFTRSSSDGLIISGNTVFNFLGVSDFTCESWIFMNSMPVAGDTWPTNFTNNFVVMECGTASLGDGFSCIIGATKIFVQSNDVQYGSVNHSMTTSTWYHVAWVRYNGVLYFYVNGTQAGSIAFAVNVGTGANTFIGSETGQGAYFDGHISNIRVVQNQALYTGAFTPSTAPLTRTTVGTSGANVAASITGTVSLLMSQNNRFLDNSVNNYTISVTTGAPKSVTLSPFAPSNYFASATSGVSGYFSGTTGDCLYQANNTSVDRLVNWFTPQFYSIECWINPTGYAVNGTVPVLIGNMDNVNATTNYWSFGLFSGGILRFYYYNGSSNFVSTTNSVPIGTWSHIAFVKVGLNIMLYINGVLSASAVISGTPQWSTAFPLTIGQYGTIAWGGYLYNLRINSSLFSTTNPYNSAIYPPVFALPAATLGVPSTLATSGVQLLTAQSATFVDNSPNTYSVNNGIAPFSGTYSYLFNGSNQYINWSAPSSLAFGTNAAFTIEFWLYVPNWSTAPVLVDWRPNATQGVYITIYSSTGGQIKFYTSSADRITTSITIPTHTWAHVAVVRNAGVTKIYINGIVDGNTYADTNSYLVGTNRPIIGNGNAASGYFYGAMSNLRVNTTAVYTTNFTPPTTALTNITGTVLLTANSTTISDTITANNPLTNSANPVVESGSLLTDNGNIPVTGTYNVALPGTKLMSVNYSLNYNLTDEFTIEFWVYCTAHGSGGGLISFGNVWQITWATTTNTLKFEGNNAAVTLTSATVLSLSTWYHIALVRAGSVMRFYINGISDSTTTTSLVAFTAVGTGSTPSIVIGADKTLSLFTSGYMSNVRFINRRAYYLQGFPIPTTPFTNPTNVNGTQLLTAQSSTVTDNSGNPIVLQPTGFAVTNSAIPFANTYSYTFNGTNSNVYTPGVVALDLNVDFTIECWFNINNTGATTSCMLLNRGGGGGIAYASYELFIINGGIYFAASSANTSYDIGGEGTAQGLIGLFSPNTWNHVAVTRNSNTYRGFLNGQMSFYQVLALTPYSVGTARGLTIGSNYQTTYFVPANITSTFNGYVSNLRIIKGNALYTNNFTPSTTPLTAVTGTSLLTLQSATLVDNSSYILPLTASGYSFSNNIIPFASGTISTGFQNNTNFTGNLPVAINTSNFSLDFWVYPQSFTNSTNPGIFDTRTSASDAAGFGVYLSSTNLILRIGATANNMLTTGANNTPFTNTYSYTFTTNTYLTVPDNALFQFGTGDFTIEMWILHTNFTAAQGLFDKAYQSAGGISMIAAITTGLVSVYMSSATPVYTETGSVATNTWYHIALTRQGNSLRFFRNGTQIGSTVTLTTQTVTAAVIESIGANLTSGAGTTPANYFNGNMSNLRIFKGAAAYTSNFTPLTSNFSIGGGGITYMTSSYYGTFDGSTTYLNVNYNANQNLAANNWTMDAWVNPSSLANGPGIMNSWQIGGMFIWYINSSGYLGFSWTNTASGISTPNFVGTSRQVALNVWSHVAVVRNGATITLYVNGQADATTYNIGAGTLYYYNGNPKDIRIGINADRGNPFTGLISNVRLVNGTALYTGAFTPSGPLANVTNTVVLTLQDSTVIDKSTTPATITNNGPVTMTFASASSASLLTLQSATIVDNSPNTFTISNPGSSPVTVSTVSGLITNGWAHVALIKNSGMIFAYLNGVLKFSVADTSTFSNTKFFVGSTFDPYYFQGYINNLRLITGVPQIVSSLGPNSIPFLPVTTQLSAITNTTLLTANLAIIGDVSGNSGTTIPQPTYITGTAYGTFFPTTSKTYLSLPSSASLWNLTADFCIECWVYPIATYNDGGAGNGCWGIIDARVGGQSAAPWNVALGITGFSTAWKATFFTGSTSYTNTTTIPLNTWTHIAWVRYGTDFSIYVNGTGQSLTSSFGSMSPGTTAPRIGTKDNTLTGYDTQGYISNFRIVKGTPVYTGNFTPVGPLNKTQSSGTNIQALSGTETVLLTLQNNSYVDNSNNNLTVTPTNTTTVTFPFNIPSTLTNSASAVTTSNSIIPFANTYSYYFNGTTQYLTGTTGTQFQFPGDFTIECWVYSSTGTGQASYSGIFDTRTTNVGSSTAIALNFSPAGYLNFYINSVNYTSTVLLGSNIWAHVALVRSGTIITLFQNGIPVAVATGMTFNLSNGYCWIGALAGAPATSFWNGYISNLRIVKGSAVYTMPSTSFSAPTSNTSITNSTVQLLTAQSATILDNSINGFSLTNTGTVTAGNSIIPFSGTYSYQFNGTNYLTATSTTSFNMATYDFTIESWIYLTSYNYGIPATLLTAQSPFIYDNSPNRFSFTNNNLVGISSTTTPFANTYSYQFNGSNQSLYIAANAAFAFGTSDFTIEAWVYFNALATITPVAQNDAVGSSTADKWYFGYTASTLRFFNHSTAACGITIPWTPTLSTWYHVAVVRYNGNFLAFVNGSQGTGTITGTPSTYSWSQNGITVGAMSSPYYTNGYISNLRIINGRALYTGSFTPSTVPLTSLATGTGSAIVGTTNGAQTGYSLWISPDASTINFTSNATGYWTNNVSATTAQLSLNTWYHIAVTRQGSTINIWRNGLSVASAATFLTNVFLSPNNAAYIGYFNDGSITRNFNGYISNLRVTQGLALYSATFSLPLSPLTVSSNVSIPPYIANNFYNPPTPGTNNTLLLFGQTASYADNSTYAVPLLPSNATPITVNSVIPYSNTYSFDFQGAYAQTYLSIPPNANFDLAYYGFTIEFWIFPRFFDSLDGTIISAGNNLAGVTWRLTGNISGALSFIGTGTVTFTTANNAINFNTWSHIAIARFNNAHTIFVNGVSKAAGYSTAVPTTTGKYLYIGYGYSSANKYQSFLISNVRFVSGTTTNVYFKPFDTPSANLTAIPNTTFLLGNSLGFGVTASQGYAPSIAAGGVTFTLPSTSVTPFANTYSWEFNGNAYITWPGFVVGTAQFTVELWFYNTTNNWTNISLLGPSTASTNALGLWINTNGNIKVDQYGVTAYNFAVPQMLQNTWYHVAAVRDGNNFCTVFLNGVRSTSGFVTNTTNYTGTTSAVGLLNTIGVWTGYISNVRIAFGVDTALYDVSALTITVPTTSLTAVTNTQLLTCQNLGMVDNSTNDYVMTNGSAYPSISDRTPFANTYSVYFSANTNYNYVKAASSTLTTFGANDFTIECWCYFMNSTASTNYQLIFTNFTAATVSAADDIWWGKHQNYSGYVAFWIYNYNAWASPLLVETTYPPNKTWVHYAVVRTGNTFNMYRNGTSTATGTYSGYVSGTSNPVYIGISGDNDGTGATTNFQGYISNFRMTKGVGVYTGTFTPPTNPLGNTQGASTNIASISTGSVVLLTCQSDQFVDNSLSNLTMTSGLGTITAGSTVVPFTGGYSINFNTAYNHWLISTTNSTQFALSGVPFTFETWIYITGFPLASANYQMTIASTINAANNAGWLLTLVGTNTSGFNGLATWFPNIPNGHTSNYNFNQNTWYHIVWTCDTIAHRFYVNGMLIGGSTSYLTWTDNSPLYLGYIPVGSLGYYFQGYISNMRIVKGSVVYGLGTFTPSTTALTTAVNSTVLLTAQSTTIVDNSILDWNILNTGAGNVTTTNSITPFSSTNSFVFNGVNNMLSISTGGANSLELQDDFTIEFWFNSNATYGSTIYTSATLLNKNGGWNIAWPSWAITLWGNSIYFGASSNNDGYDIGGEPGGYLRTTVPVGNSGTINGVGLLGTFLINTWYHIAVVRSGGIYKGYRNGTNTWTQGGMNPYTTLSRGLNIGGTYGGDIGRYNYVATWGGSINSRFVNTYGFFNGYISNIRITNGTAVYTSNFTPATSALTATTTTAYTALLTAQSSTAIDNSPITKYILGGPTYTTNSVIPFANTYSYSLLGTADNGAASGYITLAAQGPFMYTTATTPFTMEMWLYPVVKPSGNNIMSELWTGSVAINFSLGFAAYGSTGDLGLTSGTGDRIAFGYYNGSAWIITPPTTALELFKWTHVAAVFDGAYASLYLNGVLNGQIATAWTTALSDTMFFIGRRWDLASQYNNAFQGYISNLRYVKGQALYSTNFTPPTSATTASTTTSMLLNFDNANIYDASAKNDVITYSNTSISGYTKYGTGSMYFNRTDPASYLIIPATTYLVFPGDFTIECWVNLASMPASNVYPDAYWIFGTGAAATAAGTDLFVGSTLLNFNLTTTATPEISTAHGMVANTWYHIAICRAGTNLRAYVGGVLKQTATASTASSISGYNIVIGRSDIAGSANTSGGFNGYIDDLRITKYARYTTTPFTPPTGPLPIG